MEIINLDFDKNTNEELVFYPENDCTYNINFLGGTGAKNITLVFDKPNVSAKIVAFFKVKDNESFTLYTSAIHNAPNTSCDTKVRAVLYDGAFVDYKGKIVIKNTAKGSSSYLEDASLCLGDEIKNFAEPILEIDCDDVSASHSSYTGGIDEEQVFYMQSRGLSKNEAIQVLVDAFLAPIGNQ